MKLDSIWTQFLLFLQENQSIPSVDKKIYSGFPFLYLESSLTSQELEEALRYAAGKAMKGKRLSCEIVFVRMQSPVYVYRVRFYVPQEKLFCCGNGCTDCVRLRQI